MHCRQLFRSGRKRPRPWRGERESTSRGPAIAMKWSRLLDSTPRVPRPFCPLAPQSRYPTTQWALFSTIHSIGEGNEHVLALDTAPVLHQHNSSPLDAVTNDLCDMVEEILTFHDAMKSNDHNTRRTNQIRDQWSKNLSLAQRFASTSDARSFAYDVEPDTEYDDTSAQLPWPAAATFQSPRTTFQPEVALYHALKNDYQAGGDVEEVVQLETKSEVVPFAELDMLLDDIEAPEPSLEGEVASSNDDDPFIASNLASSVHFPAMSLVSQPLHPESKTSVPEITMESGGTIETGELTKPHDSRYTLSLDAWFRDDLMQTTEPTMSEPKSIALVHAELRSKSLLLLDRDNTVPLSQWEESRREAVTQALVLLRTLKESEWKSFDYPADVEDELVEEGVADETTELSMRMASDQTHIDVEHDIPTDETIPAITNLLLLARQGKVQLSTDDCNFILARMAVATDCLPDDILPILRSVYHQMMDLSRAGFDCRPNALTYEILLLALTRRFCAFQPALDLVVSLLESPSFTWTPKTLEATMQLCERKNLRSLAQRILTHLESGAGAGVDIPKRVYQSFITVMKADDARSGVVSVLQLALKRASHRHDEILDSVFVNAIRWPTQNRHKRTIDNKSVLCDILGALEQEKVYAAGPLVWKQMIGSCSMGAKDDESRWDLVVRAFRCLATTHPTFWPDHRLLKRGLAASEATLNAKLAADLIWRSVEYYQVPHSVALASDPNPTDAKGSQLSPLYIRPHVAYQDIVKALTVSLAASDMVSCGKILHCATQLDMTLANLKSLYLLCLKGYASVGDASEAEKLFVAMGEKGIQPGEEFYGALLHAYGVSNQLDHARKLLQSLESGTHGVVRPGPSCYDGYILGCVCCQAWDDAILAHVSMKQANMTPSPASCHGILLAHARRGGRRDAQTCLHDFAATGAQLHVDGVLLALSIFIPDLGAQAGITVESVAKYLRGVSETDASLQTECLALVRSLRIAELAEQRIETPGLAASVVLARRKDAHDAILRDTVNFAAATDRTEHANVG